MTSVEMIQTLAALQRDVNQAATLLSQASTKLAAVASQLMENQRTQPEPAAAPPAVPAAAPAAHPVPEVPQPVDLAAQAPEPPPETTPAAFGGPTPEVAAPDRATLEAHRKQEQLGHFEGTGSLVARFCSPEVVVGGKGFLKPGVAGLQQFGDDLSITAPQRMHEWPTGFYRSKTTSGRQLLINTSQAVLLYLGLPYPEMPLVSLKRPLPDEQKLQPADLLELMDLLLLKQALEKELRTLSEPLLAAANTSAAG